MKVIRDLKKDGLIAEHSKGPTGPVLLLAARLGSKHIFTRNPFFLPFKKYIIKNCKLCIIHCLHWKVNISMLALLLQCSTSGLGRLTGQVKLQLQDRPNRKADEAVE